MNTNFLSLYLILFTICNSLTAQVCANAVNAPTTINGVSITGSGSGSVSTYPSAFTSCITPVTTPANSLYLGSAGTFSYTYTFSTPVNNLVIAITATGQMSDENFIITTNGAGTPIINDLQSCFTSIVGNQILSGAGAGGDGGGGVFEINNSTSYTSVTITGNGGNAGALFALCEASVVVSSLPVTWLSFDVLELKKQAKLLWSTASELNSTYYLIQRSVDGIHFDNIGKVDGAGNSSTLKSYNFVDLRPFNGDNYYRIEQFDVDGQSTISGIRLVNFQTYTTSIYPNPSNGVIEVSSDNDILHIDVLDTFGKVVFSKSVNDFSTKLDLQGLSAGIYYVKISYSGQSELLKLVLN